MPYQLTEIIKRCNKTDLAFIIETIDSYINFSADKKLKKMLEQWDGESTLPDSFAQLLETEIRYAASSDVAYAYRKLRGEVPAGVDVNEIIDDIARVQKLHIKPISSLEGRLEYLVRAIVEKRILALTPEEQVQFLKGCGVESKKIEEIVGGIRNNPLKLFPILAVVLGEQATLELVKGLVLAVMASFLGKEAAKKVLEVVAQRLPGQFLGPIMWVASIGWLGVDLCGPAFRKTIPIMLTLGMVALRNGPESGDAFFNSDGDLPE